MREDVVGVQYGLITVISDAEPIFESTQNVRAVLGECSCNGNRKVYKLKNLRSGGTQSCGCYALSTRTKHGLCKSPLYQIWHSMFHRCFVENAGSFDSYGGRGIRVCTKWNRREDYKGLIAFIKWNDSLPFDERHKPGLEIDRIDVNGDYRPSNCRWVTSDVNRNNKRNSKRVKYKGKTYTRKEFYNKFNKSDITYSGFKKRMVAGMSPKEAITKKSKNGEGRKEYLSKKRP